ncbi:Tlg2p-like protein a [Asimina triloba]
MATRNRTPLYRKYRDALRSVRAPAAASSSSSAPSPSGGPVIEMVSTSLLHPNRSYAPLSTEDPGNSRCNLSLGFEIEDFLRCRSPNSAVYAFSTDVFIAFGIR